MDKDFIKKTMESWGVASSGNGKTDSQENETVNRDIWIGNFAAGSCHPGTAEHLIVSDYTCRKTKKSKLLPDTIIDDGDDFYCPRCRKKADNPQDHGDAFKCGQCGLCRQSFGNGLYIWE